MSINRYRKNADFRMMRSRYPRNRSLVYGAIRWVSTALSWYSFSSSQLVSSFPI